jgi:ubiquinone/menaquinone biosynthesis C-methylase UbiE/uncharacterized protein YbaR (Trm112 family)
MSPLALDVLACPVCHGPLRAIDAGLSERATITDALRCDPCRRSFSMADGIPNLVEPETLAAQLAALGAVDAPFANRYDRANKLWLLRRGLVGILREDRVRRAVTDKLRLAPGNRLLETSVGTASNLRLIAKTGPSAVEMHGTDVSTGMLAAGRKKMAAAGHSVAFTQSNAPYLPYRNNTFDAVLHVGAINQLEDRRRIIAEMWRVARNGGRIVISDEGVHPDKARTFHGRWILRHDVFRAEPPLDLLPTEISDLQVSWVLHRSFWVISFVKTCARS